MTTKESEQFKQVMYNLAQVNAQLDAFRVAAEQAGISLELLGARIREAPPIIEEDFL